ncbi:MAG: penicillin-binding protein 2 [Dehalococcoidia bacterium]
MGRWTRSPRRWCPPLLVAAVWLLSVACGGLGELAVTPTPSTTPAPPLRSSSDAAEAFLSLWQEGLYSEMYDLLSAASQVGIDRQAFVDRYQAIAEEATVVDLRYQLTRSPDPATEKLPFTAVFTTRFFGQVQERNTITMAPAGDEWRVVWSPSLIFSGLDDGNLVHFFSRTARRGTIYDRNGVALAVDARVAVIGVVPQSIEDMEGLVATLAEKLEMPVEEVRARIDLDVPSYYFLPVKTLRHDTPQEFIDQFFGIPGVIVREERQRVYPHGDLAAHVLGYLSEVSAEQLAVLREKGYREGDKLGAAGLEAAFEEELAGQRGGQLAIITPEGTVARVIAEKEPVAGQDVYLTIDVNLQRLAEEALGQRVGSVVVMDPNDNSILAMASYPRFDPNDFIDGFSVEEWQALVNNPDLPFLHRATQAVYPPGSTFKVVTAAAGLEAGGYTPSSRLPCPPIWYGLGREFAKRNWQSVDRGSLTLAEGLMASCNSVFYQVALTLDGEDPAILTTFARDFGLGQRTGIVGLEEEAGVVPGPAWKEEVIGEPWYSGDSVNMGIGQGFLLVTPLQLANMYNAIASGGSLRTPLLVGRVDSPEKAVAQEFQAKEVRRLPISKETLAAIRQGLTLVVASDGGTAYNTFRGSAVRAAGKSGTAEDIVFQDHVFFVAYAPSDAPQVVALVALEEGRSGSLEAGPMVRRLLEVYLLGGGGG